MRALAIATLATLALALPAAASRSDVDEIDAVIQAAIDEGADVYDLSELYAIIVDPATLPRCRQYADLALVAMSFIDLGDAYPESEMTRRMFEYSMEAVPVARNNCLLAV